MNDEGDLAAVLKEWAEMKAAVVEAEELAAGHSAVPDYRVYLATLMHQAIDIHDESERNAYARGRADVLQELLEILANGPPYELPTQ